MLISIIKIIGIIVLIIAAVVLMLLAAVLFVPLRYHIKGSFHDEKPCGDASVKWMLGVLSFKASYSGEDGAKAYISLFGRCIYDLLDDDSGEDGVDESRNESITDVVKRSAGSGENSADKTGAGDTGTEAVKTVTYTAETSSEIKGNKSNADAPLSAEQPLPEDKAGDTAYTETVKKNGNVFCRIAEKIKSFRLPDFAAVRDSVFAKLRYAADKISTIIDSTEKKLTELADRFIELIKAVKKAFDKRSWQLNALIGLWKDERYQASEKLLINRIIRLLKELKPRKGHGKLKIGFGDPYATGQAMQAAALLYPLYGDRIEVIPDFDQSVIDGEANLKGRLRLIVPVEAAVRIFLDKGLKSMYKQTRSILELD